MRSLTVILFLFLVAEKAERKIRLTNLPLKEKAEQKKIHSFSLVEFHVIPYKEKFLQHVNQKS